MAELVDAKDLKSFGIISRAGSSPALGTILRSNELRLAVASTKMKALKLRG